MKPWTSSSSASLGGLSGTQLLRPATRRLTGGLDPPTAKMCEGSLTLMIRARSRFDSVSFDPGSLQVRALHQTLDEIQARNGRTVVFYTTENGLEFDQIMDHDRATRIRSQILSFLAPYASPTLKIVPPLETIPVEHFLDFMHLDAQGYRILAQHIAPLVSDLLKQASGLGQTGSL